MENNQGTDIITDKFFEAIDYLAETRKLIEGLGGTEDIIKLADDIIEEYLSDHGEKKKNDRQRFEKIIFFLYPDEKNDRLGFIRRQLAKAVRRRDDIHENIRNIIAQEIEFE